MKLVFEKWEGLGNDFVVVEDFGRGLTDAEVQRLCDRRFGIGADGVLLVGRDPARMIVRNADGSRPEMCGNGLRCVAGYLRDAADDGGRLAVLTDAGERVCRIVSAVPGGYEIEVDMGVARSGPELVASLDGREHRFATMDLGNPHAVTFEGYDDAAFDRVGPFVATLPPAGTNVEACRAEAGYPAAPEVPSEPPRIAVTVWERGVGRTLACGTGACAVAAVACDTGRARFDEPVVVALPGGDLTITVTSGTRAVRMRGPARRVFTGEVVLA
jgi:diaminopimelate epimerase